MDNSFSRDIDVSHLQEKELILRLKDGNTAFAYLEVPFKEIRDSCCHAILGDYQGANTRNAENRLWDSHQKVNTHYRAAIAQMKKTTENKAVEMRKLRAEYLKFIKTSQKFYREFIGRLSAAYGNIPALRRVAQKFDSPEPAQKPGKALGFPGPAELEQCCHRTLIRLGDLSRYREMEHNVRDEERDWAPAIGYYDLALTVCPGSGQPFNQRAIIAIVNRNHFRATYYAYRSLTAERPHPQAEDNLRRVMSMVAKAWEKSELVSEPSATAGASLPSSLVAYFLRLVEQYSHGTESSASTSELEKEVKTQLKDNLSRESRDAVPLKLILTSIAAQQAAQMRLLNQPDNYKFQSAYVSFLQLNMRLFSTILEVFEVEITEQIDGAQASTAIERMVARALSPVVRRLLPLIRIYSSWLSKSSTLLDSNFVPDELKSELWNSLAKALTSVTATFSTDQLPNVEHLLDEDEETVGFSPLTSEEDTNVWYIEGKMKDKWHELTDQPRDITKEMLFRLKEFLVVGLTLAVQSPAPLELSQETSSFTSSYWKGSDAKSQRPRVLARPPSHNNATSPMVEERVAQPNKGQRSTQRATAPQQQETENAEDIEAERMVESIVGLPEDSPPFQHPNLERHTAPETPARPPPMSSSTFGTASPFPVGSNTVADIMATTFRQASPRSNGTVMARSMSGSRPTSQLQSPAFAPILPRQPSDGSDRSNRSTTHIDMQRIWETQYGGGGPPGLARQSGLSPSLATRPSPLALNKTHSRGNSNELNPSIWTPHASGTSGIPSKSEATSMSRSSSSRNLGNGVFFGAASPTGAELQQTGTDYGFNSSMLPSPTPNTNHWNIDHRSGKRLSAGSPLAPTSAQLPNGYGQETSGMAYGSPTRHEAYPVQARTFRPSNLQHTTAQRMT